MALGLPKFGVMKELTRDGDLLFATRFLRLFAYGFLSVVLFLYLSAQGLSADKIGVVLTLTLLGDMVISLWLTTRADRMGRIAEEPRAELAAIQAELRSRKDG